MNLNWGFAESSNINLLSCNRVLILFLVNTKQFENNTINK